MSKLKIEKITWLDAVSQAGWRRPDSIPKNPTLVTSVGIVANDTKKAMTLCISYDPDIGDYGNFLTIPKGMIKSRRIMK